MTIKYLKDCTCSDCAFYRPYEECDCFGSCFAMGPCCETVEVRKDNNPCYYFRYKNEVVYEENKDEPINIYRTFYEDKGESLNEEIEKMQEIIDNWGEV